MSEVLVVKSASGAADPRLSNVTFTVSGGTVGAQAATKAMSATTLTGSVVSATPLWWDSSGTGAGPDGAGSAEPRALAYSTTATSVSLNVADATSTPNVTYPVYVDPDWSSSLQADWFDDRAYPNQSYLDPPSDSVGYGIDSGVGYLSRAFFQFQTSFLTGKTVSNARFNIHQTYANSCDTTLVQLWEFSPATPGFTWNQEPNGWIQAIDQQGNANGGPCAPNPAWVGFSATVAAQYAAAHSLGSIQLGLRVANEADSLTRKHYDWNAQLIVTYDTPPNTPTGVKMVSPVRGCAPAGAPDMVNGTLPITIQATVTDPDTGQNTAANFYVGQASTLPTYMLHPSSTFQAQGAPLTTTFPAGTFSNGITYAWWARGSDNILQSVGSSPYCYFTIKDDPPALPGVAVASPATTVGAPMTVTITSSPPGSAAIFAYWWADGAAATPPPAPTVIGTGTALPACGSSAGGLSFACADSSGSATVSVSPIDDVSTLWVAGYDDAGNVATDSSGSVHTVPLQVSAAADTGNVTNSIGHSWLMEGLASMPATVADSNPTGGSGVSSGSALAVGAGTPSVMDSVVGQPPLNAVLSVPGLVQLNRYYGTYHSAVIDGNAPAGSHIESALGQMHALAGAGQSQPPNTLVVYSCALSSGDMTSLSSNCEGMGATGVPMGYSWTSAAAVPYGTPIQLYRCHTAVDHFDSTVSNCEGSAVDGSLGFFANVVSTRTSHDVVDLTVNSTTHSIQSFTTSAWLKPASSNSATASYVAMAASGPVNSGFVLREASGHWQFCMQSQTIPIVSGCATGPAVSATAGWTFVTGIWDAANHQVRLLIGASGVTPVAVGSYAVPSGGVAATGTLLVGSGWANSAPGQQWGGEIDDPSIYPGVVDSGQLLNLYNQVAPG
ncbi:LamG-like jellyroll fold domain-containing protein [Rathayibacter soli]|uniref:LamG-like jellyroll fold domain-containing protein n=1 Tax=Rathayibacter soli TaxID=3144168 RepID=UPI0027E503C2|nr:LamG-like jellyroll fold domain-containing protein [Glaciibacter superstes]